MTICKAGKKISYFFIMSALVLITSCNSVPPGFMGVKWGNSINMAENNTHCNCHEWMHYFKDQRFRVCDCGTTMAYGKKAEIKLVKEDDGFTGVMIRFIECSPKEIRQALIDHYDLKTEDSKDIYIVSTSSLGRIERLIHFNEKTCELILAGYDFANYYYSELLRDGLWNLENSMTPH